METEEECFSGDEVESFQCAKHQLVYTNFCNLTQNLLCQECLLKCSTKATHVVSIEKALLNISTLNKQQLTRLHKVLKIYHQMEEVIQREQHSIHSTINLQIDQLVNLREQLATMIQNKFQELIEQLEVHKVEQLQQQLDQKVIVEEYQARATKIERNLISQDSTSGFELLKKHRNQFNLNNKAIKELENESDNLQGLLSCNKFASNPFQIRLQQDLVKNFTQLVGNVDKDVEFRTRRVVSNNTKVVPSYQITIRQGVSPINKKSITQNQSPVTQRNNLNFNSKHQSQKCKISNQFLKRPKFECRQMNSKTDRLVDQMAQDISSILDERNNSPEQSLNCELDNLINIKQSVQDSIISQFEFPQEQRQVYFIIGGIQQGSAQNMIELIEFQSRQVAHYDFLISSRSGFELAKFNDQILIIGGKQEGVRSALCEQYLPQTKELKIAQLILTKGISAFAAKQINDIVFIAGGKTENAILDQFWCVSIIDLRIKQLAPIPIKCSKHSLAVSNDNQFLYLIDERQSYKYNIAQNSWQKIRQPIYPRCHHVCVTLPDGIWLFGGRQGKTYIKQVERYDEVEQCWKLMGEIFNPPIKLDALISNDNQYVYLIGGKTADGQAQSAILSYSIVTNACTHYCSMLKPRYGHKLIEASIIKF